MRWQTTLIACMILLLSVSAVHAVTYEIVHDDDLTTLSRLQERDAARQNAALQEDIDELRYEIDRLRAEVRDRDDDRHVHPDRDEYCEELWDDRHWDNDEWERWHDVCDDDRHRYRRHRFNEYDRHYRYIHYDFLDDRYRYEHYYDEDERVHKIYRKRPQSTDFNLVHGPDLGSDVYSSWKDECLDQLHEDGYYSDWCVKRERFWKE